MPSEENQTLWKYFLLPSVIHLCSKFLGFRKRTWLLLTVRWPVPFVSPLPVSFSVQVGLEGVWATVRGLAPPFRILKTFWKLAAGREPKWVWRWWHSAGVVTVSAWPALGDPHMPEVRPNLPLLPERQHLNILWEARNEKRRVRYHHPLPSWGHSSQQTEMTNIPRI